MSEINDSVSPKGIITFEMIYRAIDKAQKDIINIQERLLKLENTSAKVDKNKKTKKMKE